MKKIGITGGIGGGKSVVSKLLMLAGIPVYMADDESKRLTDTSPAIKMKLKSMFGDDIYIDERLDRKRFASIIFGDETILHEVNGIIHPVVKDDFEEWIGRQTSRHCAMESAILYESGLDKEVDVVLMVYAPVDMRMTRVMLRDGATEADIMKRMNRQMPEALKRKQADYVIINDGVQALMPQVENFIKFLPTNI
ncbi:MAG: dephospho-CoA kinase [Tannerella sp.]|jgi:dephospho-CoA kinase|nr:dephospho-CoA kinase [Tannerella sp.]